MKYLFFLLFLTVVLCFTQCKQTTLSKQNDELFQGFENPLSEARPFVRWWWNGNQLDSNEIKRQLDVLYKAGVGGVEINPIAIPEGAKDLGIEPIVWLSKEWNDLLVFAAKEAKQRGMITDMIVGSGWPFGGEFLKVDETIQRIIVNSVPCSGGHQFNEKKEDLYLKAVTKLTRKFTDAKSYEIAFVRLVPKGLTATSQVIDLTGKINQNGQFVFEVPTGDFELVYGFLQRGNREVMHGAPGAAGPVMNHYNKTITLEYLNRLKKISEDSGIPLNQLIRALFCDSIELDGSNWTDGFGDIFFQTYQYRLEPYFPFIFYDPSRGYPAENYNADIMDELKRVRYDYNKLLVRVFLDNFTKVFQDFCTANGVKCRYQAYGTPFLMGMMEGNMIPDIPESNNWIYSSDMNAEEWSWSQGHGYMIWNLYASSGGHLTGRKIISCESMTNTAGVFKTSLEEIKLHDDMNFITGINHTVLHGFNYSPLAAGFPGWVRYGSYFSEQNTWWPYFPKWLDYNARLSYVFQRSKPIKNIAILPPEGDLWANTGLTRKPFHTTPWYCFRLWEPLSQAGSSADYISEEIIKKGSIGKGTFDFGPMSYQAIILASVSSLQPETATTLQKFVDNGGKLVVIDSIPNRSLSMQNSKQNDADIKNAFAEMEQNHPDGILKIISPEKESELLAWTTTLLKKINIKTDVSIENPNKNVFQIRKVMGEKDIYFFTNSNRVNTIELKTNFPTNGKTPWVWNPEDGRRKVYPFDKKENELTLVLQPFQSILLVFEPDLKGSPDKTILEKTGNKLMSVEGPWQVRFEHMNGERFERSFDKLYDFGTSNDEQLNTFAGIVTYSTTFNSDGKGGWLELGKANKGVTEVTLNGKQIGLNWYGKPLFRLNDVLLKGENRLEIKYTTVLSNYARSLKDNPTAEIWTRGFEKIPMGLEDTVEIFDNE